MQKKILASIAFILISAQGKTQEVKFGKIAKEELHESQYVNDKSADAAILYEHRNTYLVSSNGVNELVTDIHKRIKIYTTAGFEYATEKVKLYKNRSSEEGIRKIKAVTYNLENDKIVPTDLKKDGIFKTEASYNYNEVKFTLPNVKVGSVIEFSYKITSPFIWNIDEFRFQHDIPVKRMKAEIRTPKGFRFKQTPKGYMNIYPKTYVKNDARIGMDVVVNEYHVNNMPAMKAESYVDNIDNYRSGVVFELVSVELPGYYRSYSQTWGDVAKTIGSSDDYKNELDKKKSFDDTIDSLVAKENGQYERMKLIFEYVKDNLTWNGVDGKYFYNGLKKTLKERKGNAADINLSLVAMLRYAGIEANPVIISTKDNLIPFFPTIDRLNYVLAYAVVDGKEYFMDATDEFSDLNVLPVKDYNWKGILIDNRNKVWKQINIASPGKSSNLYAINVTLNGDGSSEGSYKSRFSKHSALYFRKNYKNRNVDSYLVDKESSYSDIEIENYEVKNENTHEGTVNESFDFYNDYGADVIGDKLYIKPLAFLGEKENPFKSEKREYPIDFGYPFKDLYMVNIKVPQEFKVDYIPEPIMISLPEGLGSFKYTARKLKSQVSFSITLEINNAIISALVFPYLKEFYKQIIAKESEQLILSKI